MIAIGDSAVAIVLIKFSKETADCYVVSSSVVTLTLVTATTAISIK